MPESNVSMFSRLTFWWINDLIMTGYNRTLTREDMWKVDDNESSRYLTQQLQTAWDKDSKGYFLRNILSIRTSYIY